MSDSNRDANTQDWMARLRAIEAEIESQFQGDRNVSEAEAEPPLKTTPMVSPWQQRYWQARNWFQGLSKEGQIAAAGVGAIAALFVLKMTVALVSLVVSLSLLVAVGYAAYRLLNLPPSKDGP